MRKRPTTPFRIRPLADDNGAVVGMLPIVVASGQDEASLRGRLKNHQFIGFLTKPYTVEQLCSALRLIGIFNQAP
jgi:hypothetical protein